MSARNHVALPSARAVRNLDCSKSIRHGRDQIRAVRIVDVSAWNGWVEFAAVLHRVDRQQELLETARVAAPTLPIAEPPDQGESWRAICGLI